MTIRHGRDGETLYVGHIRAPHGASIDDVADPPDGHQRVCSNDVTIDSRGLVYLADRQAGVDIVETSVY